MPDLRGWQSPDRLRRLDVCLKWQVRAPPPDTAEDSFTLLGSFTIACISGQIRYLQGTHNSLFWSVPDASTGRRDLAMHVHSEK